MRIFILFPLRLSWPLGGQKRFLHQELLFSGLMNNQIPLSGKNNILANQIATAYGKMN
jgi:hypothetical protein